MSEQTSQEPTMEEILASIRRIISEDEPAPAAEGTPTAVAEPEPAFEAEPEPEPVHAAAPESEPEPEAEPEEEVLELTERVEASAEPAAETIGDLDVFSSPPPEPEPEPFMEAPAAAAPPPAPAPAPAAVAAPVESLISAPSAAAAASAFGQLAQRIAMPPAEQSLDNVVRELLRPLLKDWLDRNLPGIVQAKVEEEVERLARRHLS